jgi:outer membrane protein, multidrug efflux system
MRSSIIVVLACFAVLVGCKVGPNYQQPKTSTPPDWTSSMSRGETNGSVELAGWWKNFGDTNLDEYIAIAVRSNLTLLSAEAHVREARAQETVTAGSLWPSLSADAGYTKNRYGQNAFPPLPSSVPLTYNLYNANFDAAWELDVFGGTRRAVEGANAEIGAAEYSERDALVSVLAEVAREYINARAAQQHLIIAQENIKAEQDTLSLTTNRYVNGLGNDVDVQQARAALANTVAQLPVYQTAFQQSVYSLSVLLGQPPGALMDEMSAERDIPLTPPFVPVGLPSELLKRRPDVEVAERKLAEATAQIGVAKADLFPKFSLTGLAGLQSQSANTWFKTASRYYSLGPTVQWELFEAGSIRANIRVQNARQEQALDQYQQTVLTALQDTESALTAYAKEQDRRDSLKESVDASQQAYDLSTQLYKNGLIDFLRVLVSQTQLDTARDALVQSDQTVSLDLVQLYKALGGGWQEETNLPTAVTRAQ